MKDKIITAVIAIVAFLLGTLMPRSHKIEEKIVTEVVRDTIVHTEIKSVPVAKTQSKTEYVYLSKVDTVWVNDTVYMRLPRQHYFAETDDVKIWHSGIDSRIDSLVNFRQTKYIEKEVWKRHSLYLGAQTGYYSDFRLSVGAMYQYDVFRWLSVDFGAGYDMYLKQPYAMAGLKVRVYSW